jgi:hypothetical protein
MSPAKTILCGIVLSSLVACSLGADATTGRTDWRRRALRDSHVKPTATVVQDTNPLLIEPDASFDSIQLDPVPSETIPRGDVVAPGGCASCGGGSHGGAYGGDSCGECGSCGECDASGSCAGPCDSYPPMGCAAGGWLRNTTLFAGVQGFKGPVDYGINGNFGFNEGFNHGAALGGPWGVGYQLGLRAVQSDLSGSTFVGNTGSARKQVFFTGGLFRRAVCGGWQGGLAFDLMNDDYYANANLNQLRAELSWAQPGWRDIGFWGTLSGKDERIRPAGAITDILLEQTDLYAFFYRRYFQTGGEGRLWGGFTGQSDGMIGGDIRLPISARWALEGGFNYLIPAHSDQTPGYLNEGWNVAIQLVWYLGGSAHCAGRDQFHPMFNVADNGVFMVDVAH